MNSDPILHAFDPETLELFARKGNEGGAGIPQAGVANGVKVRRVLQLLTDFAKKPIRETRVLDLGCGEGVYAIESALRVGEVLAIDARTERMDRGEGAAKRNGITNLRFVKDDVRCVTIDSVGSFDVVYLLGILYHLDVPDVFRVLENVHEICDDLLIIDTHISLIAMHKVAFNGQIYWGRKVREHAEADSAEARQKRVLSSLDNTYSFWFTKESLIRLLADTGFTSILECHSPGEPFKPRNRITLIVRKGAPVTVSAYPWVNGKSEQEIQNMLRPTNRIATVARTIARRLTNRNH